MLLSFITCVVLLAQKYLCIGRFCRSAHSRVLFRRAPTNYCSGCYHKRERGQAEFVIQSDQPPVVRPPSKFLHADTLIGAKERAIGAHCKRMPREAQDPFGRNGGNSPPVVRHRGLEFDDGGSLTTSPPPTRNARVVTGGEGGKRASVVIHSGNFLLCDHKSPMWTHGMRAKCFRS